MKNKIILLLIIIGIKSISVCYLSAQEAFRKNYYDSLQEILLSDPLIEKVRFQQFKFMNGNLKAQRIFVRFKNDSSKKFWLIGKESLYYWNGKIAGQLYYSKETKLCDSSFYFSKNGEPTISIYYKNTNNQNIQIHYVTSLLDFFSRNFILLPYEYEVFIFCNNKMNYKQTYCFSEKIGLFVPNGEKKYYNEDGSIEKIEYFEMGKKVK